MAQGDDARGFRAASSTVDITPPLGTCLAGYFVERKADGILDPLKARALVCELGDSKIALISCDLIGLPALLVAEIRRAINRAVGIPETNILIACTHTHLGPCPPRHYTDDTTDMSRELYPGEIDEDYWTKFPELAAGAVIDAHRKLSSETAMGYAVGSETSISFNRRFHMRDGKVVTNPGLRNPDIVRPAGPIDPDVAVLKFIDPPVILVNFACHLDVVGGKKISADYPTHMISHIRKVLGEETSVIFFNGCCGDLNHVNVKATKRQKGYEHARFMGKRLAAEVLRVEKQIEPRPVEKLGVVSETLKIPKRKVKKEDLDAARKLLESGVTVRGSCANLSGTAFALATVALARSKQETFDVEVQAMRIGDVGIVGLPGEIFVEIGLEIKKNSPFTPTLVFELANGSFGYIPTPKAFGEGGYETSYRSAKLDESTGDRLVETALKLLNKLRDI